MTDQHDPFDDIDLRPIAESRFAVEHGVVRSAPDVAVDGPGVARARAAAGLSAADVAEAMTRRGYTTDPATVAALEASAAHPMRPREARLLAAILDQPLGAIEAAAEPWPAGQAELDTLRAAGVEPVALGADLVIRTSTGSHLGLLRCPGPASVLASRTYRLAAATRLNGVWSHLAGALLVTREPPHHALAVDALDCVTRSHAPSGLLGFSRLGEPRPLADAVAAYERDYAIGWEDPERLAGALGRGGPATGWPGRRDAAATRLADQARRARQPGKRPGYEATAAWLRDTDPAALATLLDRLAHAPDDAATELIRQALEGEP